MEARKRLGLQVMIFLIILSGPAVLHQEEGLGRRPLIALVGSTNTEKPLRGLFCCAYCCDCLIRVAAIASTMTADNMRRQSENASGGIPWVPCITFKRPDGKEASGYLANAARGNAPGVVVIQEWWGLSEQIKGLTDRFALAGFDALAPDLYNGTVVPYHDTDAANKEMNSLDFIDATTQTVRGAAQYLARNGAKVGLTGFCLGGAVTIIGACKIPELARRRGVLRHSAGAGGQARRRAGSAAGRISPTATTGARRKWSMPSRRG